MAKSEKKLKVKYVGPKSSMPVRTPVSCKSLKGYNGAVVFQGDEPAEMAMKDAVDLCKADPTNFKPVGWKLKAEPKVEAAEPDEEELLEGEIEGYDPKEEANADPEGDAEDEAEDEAEEEEEEEEAEPEPEVAPKKKRPGRPKKQED